MKVGISFLKCRTAKLLSAKQPGFGLYPGIGATRFFYGDRLRIEVNGDKVNIQLITGLTCSIKTRKLYYVAILI